MKVISNSSVLIALSGIGRLELLHNRFPEGVIIPDAVWREVVETGHGRAGAKKVSDAGWIKRRQVQNHAIATALQTTLDQGEADIGLLIWGKRRGFFPSLANELDLLQREGGFRLSKIIYEYALQLVGEQES
jgi:uncharacterized protein